MSEPNAFDDGKIADLAKQIKALLGHIEVLRKAKHDADRELSSAEVKLANLRSELTRAVDGQLDLSTLKQKPREFHEVTTTRG